MDWKTAPTASEGAEKGWEKENLGQGSWGDRRLEQRLKVMAEDLAARPQALLNQASADWAATKAAYRFFENAKATEAKIFAAHRDCTVQCMRG